MSVLESSLFGFFGWKMAVAPFAIATVSDTKRTNCGGLVMSVD
jgi:hypothetical protein